MLFLFDFFIAVIFASFIVKIFTGEPVWGQFDYLGAAIVGIIVFAVSLAFTGATPSYFPPTLVLMTGSLLGCSAYHFYKEYF